MIWIYGFLIYDFLVEWSINKSLSEILILFRCIFIEIYKIRIFMNLIIYC